MQIARQVFGHERGIELELPVRSLDPDRVPSDLDRSRQDL